MAMVVRKEHREALKKLKPVADALGVTLGKLSQTGGDHIRLPCTRADGSTFHMILPLTGSDRRNVHNMIRDLKMLAKKSDRAPL